MAESHFSGPVVSANGFEAGTALTISGTTLTASLPDATLNAGRMMIITDDGIGGDEWALVISDGATWVRITTTALT